MLGPIENVSHLTEFPVSITEQDIEIRLQELQVQRMIQASSKQFYRDYYFGLLDEYKKIKPGLNIGDPLVARLCQVLTDNGLVTMESCQGHLERAETPFVSFTSRRALPLKLLSRIVRAESQLVRFRWQVTVDCLELDKPVLYWLEPQPIWSGNHVKKTIALMHDQPELVKDLDYLGLSIMSSFQELPK